MFSTICLLFLSGFILWMNTSGRISWPDKNRIMSGLASSPAYCRYAAFALFLAATALCVVQLGLGSGIFAAIVILMTAGSVSVLFFPFPYFGIKSITILYICALALELIIY
ncbi:hypothetical protein [Dyadobacter aurulentus]|uniref:hypothetical protein n=1 Tax=Dyadobacter sp. UC 10 TaxID=2605428 RepID=UPI0011F3D60A|nr:hypothetical protein [Dyadobacter sp. UC 10]KAA0988738.1 hypothetical protein FXO21_00440 [Dyadobacter sp. UC 10]